MPKAKKPDHLRGVFLNEVEAGLELRLGFAGYRELYANHGDNYLEVVTTALLRFDVHVMEEVLLLAGRKNGAPHEITFDDLGDFITLDTLQGKLLDAVILGAHGRTWEEHCEYVQEQIEEAERKQREREAAEESGDEDPTTGPEDGSESSSEQPTGPA